MSWIYQQFLLLLFYDSYRLPPPEITLYLECEALTPVLIIGWRCQECKGRARPLVRQVSSSLFLHLFSIIICTALVMSYTIITAALTISETQ